MIFISFTSKFYPLKQSILIHIGQLPPTGARPQARARITTTTTRCTNAKHIMSTHTLSRVIILTSLLVFSHFVVCSGESEAETLITFKGYLKNTEALSNWDNTKPPCNGDHEIWNGVLCENGNVWGLKLENMGLNGILDVDSLSKLQNLRTISLMNNNFDGPLPSLSKLSSLKTMYLSNNKFSGQISGDAFGGMASLKKVHLANNKFSGLIPASLAALPKLMELMLENNEFDGEIPFFSQERIKSINLSNNKLMGEIPRSLSNFSASMFEGNNDLCGAPLKSCNSPDRLTVGAIVLVALLVLVALAALVAVVIILRRRRRSQTPHQPVHAPPPASTIATTSEPHQAAAAAVDLDQMEQGGNQTASAVASSSSTEKAISGGAVVKKPPEHSVKLTFLQEDRDKFDMTDLLKASAEILGSGVFGSTYKAGLNEGVVMVVKRYKHMNNVNREEFNEHMRRLGRLRHPNLLPIVAFYYRKEEKLLLSDYVDNGSLAVHLHGNKSRGLPCPDWPTRLNIVKGVAQGLSYLYKELPSITTPHGHLKSSNVLLDASFNPLLHDYGLIPVVNQEHAQESMISYKSPEYKHNNRITRKTDTWSFGILILEILTGRFPSNFLQQGKGSDTDLATWVESVVRDYDNSSNVEVFDKDMDGIKGCRGEMMKLLNIGLVCCMADVDRRPDINQVVGMIDEVKVKDGE
ncbi:hypothetical protein BUALT_Bualt09G0052000 [Buddleja alternifolia]|uniref:Protein kinase domain-containing protein n=1 Tax=Buddleja alternifolia TaxID=168488 RepID=A0AAV6XAV8_9LAMI|nr:hypothetical protein BUALT_Bualt09G0052000 [Buddleja alternifolia]